MANTPTVYKRYIFAVSDASGKTCRMIVNAALSQFKSTEVILKTISDVLTIEQIEEIVHWAAGVNGIIIYTMVSPEFRRKITELGRLNGVPTVDILGPVLIRLTDMLEISPLAQPGLFRQLDDDYYMRIEAVDFTIKHDDGLGLKNLDQAEIVILGVSRTTKTPVSIYLSYRGWKVGNIPLIYGRELQPEVTKINPKKVIALTVKPEVLLLIRRERERRYKDLDLVGYTNVREIEREVNFALDLYKKLGCQVVDVTHKSIEETSTEIMRLIYQNMGSKKGMYV
ncbi:MAG: kinase/pyrophosphorylase [Candidatus Aminicenantes bacterium]|nr:kinase/pyrophosphorylase [Candidatus Aminicenantes bacterium]